MHTSGERKARKYELERKIGRDQWNEYNRNVFKKYMFMLTVPFARVKDWEWPSNLASNFRLEVVFQLHSFHWERWTWEICKRAKIYCRIFPTVAWIASWQQRQIFAQILASKFEMLQMFLPIFLLRQIWPKSKSTRNILEAELQYESNPEVTYFNAIKESLCSRVHSKRFPLLLPCSKKYFTIDRFKN